MKLLLTVSNILLIFSNILVISSRRTNYPNIKFNKETVHGLDSFYKLNKKDGLMESATPVQFQRIHQNMGAN